MYYYVKNLQGDVIEIINQAGTIYATYEYDAWGNIESDSGEPILRRLNPFRYRSYVYDNETGLYYLKSRYYDPTTGRFLNADGTEYIDFTGTVLGTNMFAYCENNSIRYIDITGTYNISNFNCYSYAIGYSDRWLHPGSQGRDVHKTSLFGTRVPYSVQQVADCVINDGWCTGKSVRPLKSKNSKLNKGEYMIAARVAKYPLLYKKKNVKNKTYYNYDFHFMKKDPKTGKWWTKSGTYKIICKGKIDPDKKSNWAMPGDKNYKTVYSGYPANSSKLYKVYYNSDTKYLAVKGKFWTT